MDLRDLYQDIILDHGQRPRNKRVLAAPSHLAHGHNPLCGDKVTVYLEVAGDRIVDVAFEGRGCAISVASASLMTEVLKGKSLSDAKALFDSFHAKVTGAPAPDLPDPLDEDDARLEPLAGVKAYPVRVKCATLSWRAMEAALASGAVGVAVKTE